MHKAYIDHSDNPHKSEKAEQHNDMHPSLCTCPRNAEHNDLQNRLCTNSACVPFSVSNFLT